MSDSLGITCTNYMPQVAWGGDYSTPPGDDSDLFRLALTFVSPTILLHYGPDYYTYKSHMPRSLKDHQYKK